MMRSLHLSLWLLLSACATVPEHAVETACHSRMVQHVAALRPAFADLGFRFPVHLRLDEDMADSRGFRKPANVLGDALTSGSIRLRPSRVCVDEALARGVIAHEMAHVALGHMGVINTGLTLSWEKPPQQEIEADELATRALIRSASDPRALEFLYCRLGVCGGLPPQPRGKRKLPTLVPP